MTIRYLVNQTKKSDPDITGIIVSIQDMNDKELYFGELKDMPEEYNDLEIVDRWKICASSDEKRNGANVLVVE